ncbi:MAG: hypothetical protein FWE80_04455 [Oscillospiraceae bacterium]|nr:hypothetical protein [Oscillospiraceae bacterium]
MGFVKNDNGEYFMKNNYWVCHFAERRQDQLIQVPLEYVIHPDFMLLANDEEIRAAFSRLHTLYFQIYGGIAESPEEFGMPLYSKEEYRNFSQQCRNAAQASFRPFILLYNLLTCGEIHDCSVHTSIKKFNAVKPRPKSESPVDEKITNAPFLFQKLTDYGFAFEGLKNNKITDKDIVISYPDDTLLLHLWKMLADKTKNVDCMMDFLHCSFRLLQDDMHTKGYDDLIGFVDTFPVEAEKAFVYKMDETLISIGLFRGEMGYYYRTEGLIRQKGPYSFRIININKWNPWHSEVKPEKVELGLRIRNVYSCIEYLQTCPDSVKRIFTEKNDSGCQRRRDNACKHGVSYEIDGQAYWRCACCDPAFCFQQPNIEDIPHYIKLVELGEKK